MRLAFSTARISVHLVIIQERLVLRLFYKCHLSQEDTVIVYLRGITPAPKGDALSSISPRASFSSCYLLLGRFVMSSSFPKRDTHFNCAFFCPSSILPGKKTVSPRVYGKVCKYRCHCPFSLTPFPAVWCHLLEIKAVMYIRFKTP